MATHEENLQDPAWLAKQAARYKGEASALARERDGHAARARELEERALHREGELKRLVADLAMARARLEAEQRSASRLREETLLLRQQMLERGKGG